MRIYLGGHLNFYHPQKEAWLELYLQQPAPLKDVLEASGIPLGEVYLVVIEGELVDMEDTIVSDQSEVKLFPPVGGGMLTNLQSRGQDLDCSALPPKSE